MLREFDLALSTGAAERSGILLKEIESLGGISHENVAFLRVRRLSRLGREADILADGSLAALVYTEPPFLVREAVLGAWARLHVLPQLENHGVAGALAATTSGAADIAMLVDKTMLRSKDNDVATACALVAHARGDYDLVAAIAADHALPESVDSLHESPPEPDSSDAEIPPQTDAGPEAEILPSGAVPSSWLEWVTQLAGGTVPALAVDVAEAWPRAWTVDYELADAIDALPDLAEDGLISGVAALLDTDDSDHAAPATAAALIRRYLLAERFGPADLTAICALLQIYVRSGPALDSYASLLRDIRDFAQQWVSVQKAVHTIDIADVVACGPSGDSRDSFVSALLGPLNAQKSRLSASLRGLAELVSTELGLGLDWAVPDPTVANVEADSPSLALAPKVLLYSLDTGTLARTQCAIKQLWPHAAVDISADKVGSASLKQHARNADIVVLATRRAAHAATGFITSNVDTTSLVGYADGSGSASMLRATETMIGEWAT